MAQVAPEVPPDDFSDLQYLDLDEPFLLTESETSSNYDDEEMDRCILEYDLEAVATKTSIENASNLNDVSFESQKCKDQGPTPLGNQAFRRVESNEPIANPSLISDALFKLGKRKIEEILSPEASPESQRAFKQPRKQDVLPRTTPSNATVAHIDPHMPIINSPPYTVAQAFSKLPYGAQYEIARLVNNFKDQIDYPDFLSLIADWTSMPTSSNAVVAPLISKGLVKKTKGVREDAKDPFAALFEKENRVRNPWDELDREEATASDPFGAMGYNNDGSPSYFYGGQVQFRGTLSLPRGAKIPILKLEAPTLGPSTQFGRRLGSKSLFRIKLSREVQWMNPMALLNYFRRPFIICGAVFRSFYSKENNVFLVKTNERWDGTSVLPNNQAELGVMSFMDFINWHNSLELNCNQAMAKWASRTALGLSNSVPGILLPPDSIRFIPDIVNPESGADMTDGAGSMNRAVVRKLMYHYDWHQRPSAIQVRAHGAKGLLVEDIKDDSEDPIIYLAPSQIKIKYPASDDDRAHRAIDVLRTSHLKTRCQLYPEFIVNLAENGVPLQVFVDLLKASLDQAISPLLDWDRNLGELWRDIEHSGCVLNGRLARERPGIARVEGWSERDVNEQNNDDEDDLKELVGDGANSDQQSLAWWADPISGLPSPLAETIIEALDSGFTPQNCAWLRDKLGKYVAQYVDRMACSYHIIVPMSCSGMIVPDRSGVLAEGELFVKASGRHLQLLDGTYTDILVNVDVLVGRYPCKLPTDIRKWKAVYKLEFEELGMTDVIVLPTQGSRRAADWLAGGDYDGDTVLVIWQPELVEAFQNADEKYADPPKDMESRFFQKEVERVSTFLEKTAGLPEIEKIHELQYHLLGALRNTSLVGRYSNYHNIAVYQKGYEDPETRRLATMFCTVLDSVKSGLTVKPEVLADDARKYGFFKAPSWTEGTRKGNSKLQSPISSNSAYPQREKGLGAFIMDRLFEKGKELRGEWKGKIERKTGFESGFAMDTDLVAPYQEFELIVAKETDRRKAADEASGSSTGKPPLEEWSYAKDSALIRKHVEDIYKEYKEKVGHSQSTRRGRPSSSLSSSGSVDSAALAGLPIEKRQDIFRSLSRKFAMYPRADELHMPPGWAARVKASYAYVYDCEQQRKTRKWTRFPWDVAFRDLCDIKGQVDSGYKTVRRESFYDRMSVKEVKK